VHCRNRIAAELRSNRLRYRGDIRGRRLFGRPSRRPMSVQETFRPPLWRGFTWPASYQPASAIRQLLQSLMMLRTRTLHPGVLGVLLAAA